MIKKPEAVLDRLASDNQSTEVPNIALSKFIFCNGHALPLPRVSRIKPTHICSQCIGKIETMGRKFLREFVLTLKCSC